MPIDNHVKSGYWFVDLLLNFAPAPEDIRVTGAPEEMIQDAARRAFWTSTAMSALWGPVGLATILPEIVALIKIQMHLVYKIAYYHQKRQALNHTVVLLIFANALGVTVGPRILRTIGTRVAVKTLSLPMTHLLARKIGAAVTVRVAQRAAGRWIPVLLAPVFGLFSKRMTRKIGHEAHRLFSRELVDDHEPDSASASRS